MCFWLGLYPLILWSEPFCSNSHILVLGSFWRNNQHGRWGFLLSNDTTWPILVDKVAFGFNHKVIIFFIIFEHTHMLCLPSFIFKTEHVVHRQWTSKQSIVLVSLVKISIKVKFDGRIFFYLVDNAVLVRCCLGLLLTVWLQLSEPFLKVLHGREALFVFFKIVWVFKNHALGWTMSLRHCFLLRTRPPFKGVVACFSRVRRRIIRTETRRSHKGRLLFLFLLTIGSAARHHRIFVVLRKALHNSHLLLNVSLLFQETVELHVALVASANSQRVQLDVWVARLSYTEAGWRTAHKNGKHWEHQQIDGVVLGNWFAYRWFWEVVSGDRSQIAQRVNSFLGSLIYHVLGISLG